MRKGLLFILLSFLALVFISINIDAQAIQYQPDFKFTVPIDVKDLHPDIQAVRVECVASTDEHSPYGGVTIGKKHRDFTLVNGSYRGTAIISFDANPGKEPGRAKGWACSMRFIKTNGQELSHTQYCVDPVYAQYPCQAGAPIRALVTGSF
jgi:hypothetical protein